MALITLSQAAVEYGDRTVFAELSLRVEPGDRIGILGSNGQGKSSLLALLAGTLEPSQGSADRLGRLLIAYLPQESPAPVAETVLGEAMASRTDISALRDRMAQLEQEMATPGDRAEVALRHYGEAQATYDGLGGYDLEARARAVLSGLGLGEEEQTRAPTELSVGQIRRLELAKLLLQEADLLLLDEPTNHLDLAAIEWLESHLLQTGRTLCLVAHDRRLLDRLCTRMLELEAGRVEVYEGSYQSYLRQRAERRLRWRRSWEAQQAHISHQEEYIRRYKAGQRARQARGRQTLLDRLDRIPEPVELRRMHLTLHADPSAQVLLRTERLVCGRDGVALLEIPDLNISRGERLAILGPNGAGKSTLLHTLTGELAPVSGKVLPGARSRVRLYRQDFGDLDSELTVLQSLMESQPLATAERARTVLGAMLFSGERVMNKISELSGGEKARVALSRLGMDGANLLLLDEPTNHLDIPSQEVLEEAIRDFAGGVIVISHDRYFVDAVATTVLTVRDGRLEPVAVPPPVERTPEATRRVPTKAPIRPAVPRASAVSRGSKGPGLEQQILRLEAERAELEVQLADPATYSGAQAGELGRRFTEVAEALDQAYNRWTEQGS